MENKLIIVFTGPEGSGRTTVAKMIAGYHSGEYYSVHESLCKLVKEHYGFIPKGRDEFTKYANRLRRKKKDSAIAIKDIVRKILENDTCKLHVVETVYCPGEMGYMEKKFANKGRVVFMGIMSMPDQRIKWMNENPDFEKVGDNAALVVTREWRREALAGPRDANIQACLEKIPEDLIFENEGEGHMTELYLQIKNKIPW